jgi:hypothetical protein
MRALYHSNQFVAIAKLAAITLVEEIHLLVESWR